MVPLWGGMWYPPASDSPVTLPGMAKTPMFHAAALRETAMLGTLLTPTQMFVLWAMMACSDDDGWVDVPRLYLCRLTRLKGDTVKKAMRGLRDAGCISHPQRVRSGGYRWRLTWRDVPSIADAFEALSEEKRA